MQKRIADAWWIPAALLLLFFLGGGGSRRERVKLLFNKYEGKRIPWSATHFRYWLLPYYHKNESLLYSEISMKGTQNAFNEIQMLESGFPWISLSRLCAIFPSPPLCGGASPPCLIMSEISSLAWFQKHVVCLEGKDTPMFKAVVAFIWYLTRPRPPPSPPPTDSLLINWTLRFF